MPTYKEHNVLTGEVEAHKTDSNICHNCGSETPEETISTNSSVMPGMCLCKDCRSEYEQAKRRNSVEYETDDDGIVINVNIGGVGGTSDTQINYEQTDYCAVCESGAAGDCQLLGKIVCQSCFMDAKSSPEKMESYRNRLREKYGDVREVEEEKEDEKAKRTKTIAENLADEKESNERPDDYEKWTLEQWKDAYVEGEINIIALEIGVANRLEEEMEFSGPGSEKFERSVEIATELSDGPIKEKV